MICRSRHDMSKITVQVLSYNRPTKIEAPLASDISSLKVGSIRQLFASTTVATLLLPDNLASLIQGTAQAS
jgi:hypothetical protein